MLMLLALLFIITTTGYMNIIIIYSYNLCHRTRAVELVSALGRSAGDCGFSLILSRDHVSCSDDRRAIIYVYDGTVIRSEFHGQPALCPDKVIYCSASGPVAWWVPVITYCCVMMSHK